MDERLSWPGWLTYSGRFIHISGHPSATGRAQDSEKSPSEDRRSSAVPDSHVMYLWCLACVVLRLISWLCLCVYGVQHASSSIFTTSSAAAFVPAADDAACTTLSSVVVFWRRSPSSGDAPAAYTAARRRHYWWVQWPDDSTWEGLGRENPAAATAHWQPLRRRLLPYSLLTLGVCPSVRPSVCPSVCLFMNWILCKVLGRVSWNLRSR